MSNKGDAMESPNNFTKGLKVSIEKFHQDPGLSFEVQDG
jgi:hypothetical protein